jgi:hypothetical protein
MPHPIPLHVRLQKRNAPLLAPLPSNDDSNGGNDSNDKERIGKGEVEDPLPHLEMGVLRADVDIDVGGVGFGAAGTSSEAKGIDSRSDDTFARMV